MLERIGVDKVDDLYADVPADVIFRGEYDLPEGMSEHELREWFRKLGAKNERLTVFAGRLRPLQPFDCGPSAGPQRVLHGIYALSARNLAGHAAVYLRISEHDKRAHRHGGYQCLDV